MGKISFEIFGGTYSVLQQTITFDVIKEYSKPNIIITIPAFFKK